MTTGQLDIASVRQRAEAALRHWLTVDAMRLVARDVLALATRLERDQEKLVAVSQYYEEARTEVERLRKIETAAKEALFTFYADYTVWPVDQRYRRRADTMAGLRRAVESSAAHAAREEAGE